MTDTLTITREWMELLNGIADTEERWKVLSAVFAFANTENAKKSDMTDGLTPIGKSVFMTMKTYIQNRKRWNRFYSNHKNKRKNQTFESNGSKSELNRLNQTFESNAHTEQELPLNIKEVNGNLKKDNTMDSFKDLKEKTSKESPKTKRKIFVPPTLEEVRDYAMERNSPIDPEEFHSFYSSKNWYVGKTKMVDWHKAFVYWERNLFNRARRRNSPPPRDYSGI